MCVTRKRVIGGYYPGSHLYNMICDLCKSSTCDQRHLMVCSVLKEEVPELRSNTKVKYSDLFESNEKIVLAAKLFSAIDKKREELLEEKRKELSK